MDAGDDTNMKPWGLGGDFLDSFDWDGKRRLRVLFCTWGSRGDIQPNIALGLELVRRGHHVTVMGLERYRSLVECHGESHLTFLEYTDSHVFHMAAKLLEPGANILLLSAQFTSSSFEELVTQYVAAAQDADVLFGCTIPALNLALYTTAQVAKKPLFLMAHDPFCVMPTCEWSFDPATNRISDYGSVRNKINSSVVPFFVGFMNTIHPWSLVRSIRSAMGLRTAWPFMASLGASRSAQFPTFCTWDQTLWPLPKDISPLWHGVGFLETKSSFTESSDFDKEYHAVLAWIEARQQRGRGFIYAGCGSFDHHDRTFFTDLLLGACEALHLDLITIRSTVDEREDMPESVFVADGDLPHASIFPLCQAVIHHGGAGTSQQVIRSGVPSICVPAMAFQAMWGHALEEQGSGLLLTHAQLKEAHETEGVNSLKVALQRIIDETKTSPGQLCSKMKTASLQLAERSKLLDGTAIIADKMLAYLRSAIGHPH